MVVMSTDRIGRFPTRGVMNPDGSRDPPRSQAPIGDLLLVSADPVGVCEDGAVEDLRRARGAPTVDRGLALASMECQLV